MPIWDDRQTVFGGAGLSGAGFSGASLSGAALTETALTVETGPQSGAAHRIRTKRCVVGDHAEADVRILVSEADAPRVEILRDAASLALGPLAVVGDAAPRRLKRKDAIVMGDVVMRTEHRRLYLKPLGAALAAVFAVGLWTNAPAVSVFGPESAFAAGALETAGAPPAAAPDVAGMLDRFRAELSARGFDDRLRVRRERNEAVAIVEGSIRPAEAPAWRGALAWFERNLATDLFLLNMVRIEDRKLVVPFKAVAVIGPPTNRLRLSDGSEFTLGDELPGGWRVDAITATGVQLSRGADRIRLSM